MGYVHLSIEEREQVSRGLAQGLSFRHIGRQLGRSASTISREVRRNAREDYAAQFGYLACEAQRLARRRRIKARRPCKLGVAGWLRGYVRRRLRQLWSPQQIATRLRLDYPDEPEKWVSHQTIYYALVVMPRGELKRELVRCLRMLSKRGPRTHKDWVPEELSIHNRPPEIESRQVPGHWEGDLLIGQAACPAAVGTLVERTTRRLILIKLPARDAFTTYERFAAHLARIPASLRKSLTYDRGKEMAEHARLTAKVGINVYFADPHSPWQRGTNENTNGLLRQYMPKGKDLSNLTQAQLDWIAKSMNDRPRATLGFLTPNEAFAKLLNSSVALQT